MQVQRSYLYPKSPYALSGLSGLRGMPAVGTFHGTNSTTCGWFGCQGTVLPDYYTAGLSLAQGKGISIPIFAQQAGDGAGVTYVNPDGTVGRVMGWANYPPTDFYGEDEPCNSGIGNCHSFVLPSLSVWAERVGTLGIESMGSKQAAALAALQAAAAAASNAPIYNPVAQTGGTDLSTPSTLPANCFVDSSGITRCTGYVPAPIYRRHYLRPETRPPPEQLRSSPACRIKLSVSSPRPCF